jgi:hypothetical protein
MKYAIWSQRIDRPDEAKELPDEYIEAPGLIEAFLLYKKNNIPDCSTPLIMTFHFEKKAVPAIEFVCNNYNYLIITSSSKTMTIEDYVEYLKGINNEIK